MPVAPAVNSQFFPQANDTFTARPWARRRPGGLGVAGMFMATASLAYTVSLYFGLVAAIVLAVRYYVDHGYPFYVDKRYYGRRWASPKGEAGERVQKMMQEICMKSVGELLPHPALHDLRALAKDKLVMVLFDKKTDEPVMFHMAFRAGYTHDVVIHLGLVMVVPAHQGRHLQRRSMLNMVFTVLTFFCPSFIMTDIADSPSNTKLVGDTLVDLFPNYRHNNRASCGARPQPWQLDVARFMMDYHRADFGTSPEAVLDEETFVVRNSNVKNGGSAVLTRHGDKRRSRASLPNMFVESLLGSGGTCDELFHVGRASLFVFAFQEALRAFDTFRAAVMASIILRMLIMVPPAIMGRVDTCVSIFRLFCRRSRLTVQIAGSPAVVSGGVLWVSNHYTWMDYPVLMLASTRLLRVVARADLGKEGAFGALAQMILRAFGVIEYQRGDKRSGATVRKGIHEALAEDGSAVLLFPEGTSQIKGPPKPFRIGGMQVAFECGRPVQPVALWYSELVGLAPETDALLGTAQMLRHPTQVVVKFCDLVWPKDFKTAEEFSAAVEAGVRKGYAEIALAECDEPESPAAKKCQ